MYLHISELKCGSRSLSEWHFSVTLNDLVCLSLHLIVEEWKPEEMDASLALCSVLSRVGGLEELVHLWRKNKFTDSCQLYTGEISTDSRLEVFKYYGEWRPGKSRKQKRATKLAKHLGIPVQRGDEPELFFYGKESGVVGMKVVDLPQSKCMHSEATLQDGYDKVRLHWWRLVIMAVSCHVCAVICICFNIVKLWL